MLLLFLLLPAGTALALGLRQRTLIGNSMQPAFQPHQLIFYWKYAYTLPNLFHPGRPFCRKKPRIDDIIVFTDKAANKLLIKRVAADSFSSWEIDRHQLTLSRPGHPVRTVSLSPRQEERLKRLRYIPDDCFFVLGDNEAESRDSRDFGLVEMNDIQGRVITPAKRLQPIQEAR